MSQQDHHPARFCTLAGLCMVLAMVLTGACVCMSTVAVVGNVLGTVPWTKVNNLAQMDLEIESGSISLGMHAEYYLAASPHVMCAILNLGAQASVMNQDVAGKGLSLPANCLRYTPQDCTACLYAGDDTTDAGDDSASSASEKSKCFDIPASTCGSLTTVHASLYVCIAALILTLVLAFAGLCGWVCRSSTTCCCNACGAVAAIVCTVVAGIASAVAAGTWQQTLLADKALFSKSSQLLGLSSGNGQHPVAADATQSKPLGDMSAEAGVQLVIAVAVAAVFIGLGQGYFAYVVRTRAKTQHGQQDTVDEGAVHHHHHSSAV